MDSINPTHKILRSATRKSHVELDNKIMMRKLLAANLCITDYALTLYLLQKWYAFFEQTSHEVLNIELILPHVKCKNSLIQKDLDNLTITFEDYQVDPIELCWQSPNDNSVYFNLGLLYVFEGSTLGGLVLNERIKRSLKRYDVTHFYDCYGSETLSNFSKTLDYIDGNISSSSHVQELIKGALYGFSSLSSYLTCFEQSKLSA